MVLKPYYKNDLTTLYKADCRELLPSLKFDVILTDPPYGIKHNVTNGKQFNNEKRNYRPVYGDNVPFDPRWLVDLGKPVLLFGANHYADKLPISSGWVVWDKMRPEDLYQATAELAWSNFVKGIRVFRFLWNGAMRQSREELVHPTQKPVELWRWVLNLRWMPAGIVCDPYAGSGSTLVACQSKGRQSIGIEIEESYCEIIAQWLDKGDLGKEIDSRRHAKSCRYPLRPCICDKLSRTI